MSVLVDNLPWIKVEKGKSSEVDGSFDLWIHRSPLVRETSGMYAEVLNVLLSAERVERIFEETFDDPRMMHGECIVTQLRITPVREEAPAW